MTPSVSTPPESWNHLSCEVPRTSRTGRSVENSIGTAVVGHSPSRGGGGSREERSRPVARGDALVENGAARIVSRATRSVE